MSSPFRGEIRVFGFNYAPQGWAFCQGQILNISQNSALYALLGTTFGGNGSTTFGLPDFRGRAPLHFGQGSGLANIGFGTLGGEASHVLTTNEIPTHTHAPLARDATADRVAVAGNVWANSEQNPYSAASPSAPLAAAAIATAGNSTAHPNEQPYLVLNFCISLDGLWPSRT